MTMYRLDASRTQWAVGHGFFHTGTIETRWGSTVRYAYDCGSLSQYALPREREIKQAAARANRHIDLFFVSHFDYDHVSGIESFANQATVDNFVIPLTRVAERLFRLAGRLTDEGTYPTDQNDYYWRILADPPAALGQLGGAVTSVVPGVPLDAQTGDVTTERPSPIDVGRAVGRPIALSTPGQVTRAACDGDEVWMWATYVTPAVDALSDYFTKLLVAKNLVADELDLSNPSELSRLVLEERDKLIECYDETVRQVGSSFTRNLTSLTLYSGPTLTSLTRSYRSRALDPERAEIGAWDPNPGWLGCGDADFRATTRVSDFNRNFKPHKRLVGTFAPSHHGSPLDWDEALLTGFGVDATTVPVCVFGASGVYGHPGLNVLLAINDEGGQTVVVGAGEASRWTERMTVFVGC